MHRPPGPAPRAPGVLSSVRYVSHFLRDSLGFVGQRFGRYGDIYNAPSNGVDLFVLRKPEHVRHVLVSDAESYDKSHSAFATLSRLLGEGLLTTEGDVWRRHRRLANPAFARKAIEGYVPAIASETAALRATLRDGEQVDVKRLMIELTLRIVGRTLLGAETISDLEVVAKAMQRMQWSLAAPRSLPRMVTAPIDWLVDGPHAEVHRMLDRAIATRRGTRRDPPDLMQMLIDASDPDEPGGRLSEKEIKDELLTFLLAGHETTSNTLCWALDLLSRAPEVRDQLVAEARALPGLPTAADIPNLAWTEQIIKEALRLYPPAYVLARRANRDTKIGEFDVATGTEIVAWIYFTHRDPHAYPDPEAFRPERFEKAAEAALPRGAFLPFGAGPRACIGKGFAMVEAIVALASLHQEMVFEATSSEPAKPSPRITLTPAGRVKMRVKRFG